MRVALKLALLVIVLSVALTGHSVVYSQSREDDVRDSLVEAFEAVREAEGVGGEVSGLLEDLNEALRLIEAGGEWNLAGAEEKIESVLSVVPLVRSQGIVSTRNQQIVIGVVLGLVAVSAVVVWRLGPRFFWSLWLRSKSDWRVMV